MSLTLPDAFTTKTTIKENWLFQLFYDDESSTDFFGLSLYDTSVDSVDYKGAIISKPSIKESINLETSTASTSNISLTLTNFIDNNGGKYSTRLLGGSNKYINRTVKVYIQPNDDDDLDECLLVYTGRLEKVTMTKDTIGLIILAKRIWDNITIPNQDDRTTNNIYKPVAYGDFTDSGTDPDEYAAITAHPIKYCTEINRNQYYLTGQGSSGSKGALFWDKYLQQFAKIDDSVTGVTTILGEQALKFPISSTRSTNFFFSTIRASSDSPGSDSGWQDTENLFKDTGFSYLPAPTQSSGTTNKYLYINCPTFDGEATALTLKIDTQFYGTIGSANGFTLKLKWGSDASEWHSTAVEIYSTNETKNFSLDILSKYNTENKQMMEYLTVMCVFSGNLHADNHQIRVSNARIEAVYRYPNDATRKLDNKTYDKLYCGADGQISEIDESAITEIHEAYRDILHRYTSYAGSNTPTNWSDGTDLNAAKDWKIRYWILEPTPLIEVLEKLQFEGGFIGRFDGQNVFKMIYIPDTPSSTKTLTINDITDINISITDFGSLSTKMEIEYQKHPAEDKYIATATSTNSSTRTNYNIQTKEGIKRVRLDAYVSPTINTSGGTKNDCFYRYYDHILGQPRVIVETTVVNPSCMGIDVGDIIIFDYNPLDSTVQVFANSWDDYKFMITDTTRTPGKLKITAREI
tara:strand:+ start:5296 stop:7368 length:2073 start_codon:yes stop_codon:yes gene_type:complete